MDHCCVPASLFSRVTPKRIGVFLSVLRKMKSRDVLGKGAVPLASG